MHHTFIKYLSFLILIALLSTFSSRISADTKVGTPSCNFSVSPVGGAVCSVDIECPKGINGIEPHISLTYNSNSGYGWAGYGMTLSGISVITIGGRDHFHDYYTKGLLYDGHDSFYLDGKRLILNGAEYVSDGAVLTVEGDPYTTVTAHGTLNDQTANMWFEVKTPDGMTYK